MKQLLLIFAILMPFGPAFAQNNVPDMELIEYRVSDPASEFYYPRLMDRYERNDTTLTFNDYYHLYYGYPFQENYKPLLKTNYADSLNAVFSNRRVATGNEFSKIERYAKAILSVEPFNMRDINILAFTYQKMGYRDRAELQMYKLNMLSRVIRSTGNGLSEETPWYITYPEHAYDLLSLLEVDAGRKIIINKSVEFISCKNSPDKSIKGYYFDYSEVYKRTEYLDEVNKPKRKLEVNPIPKDKDIK